MTNKFDLKALGAWLIDLSLMDKRFCDMSKEEITDFCEQVHTITDQRAGFSPPYINDKNELIIPYYAPDRYRWWGNGGQSIEETLNEIGASEYVKRRYVPKHDNFEAPKKTIFVIDIETTSVDKNNGSIVEIGIVSLDLNTGDTSIIFDSLVLEKSLKRTDSNAWIFNNSNLKISDVFNAPKLGDVLPEIQRKIDSFSLGGTAYNNVFDFGWMENRGIKFPTKLPCPMKLATPILKLQKNGGGHGYKWPNVEEAWKYYFPDTPYIEAHRGADDAVHEAKIVYEMYLLGEFKIEGVQ